MADRIPTTRVFSGKRYRRAYTRNTKSAANSEAKELRGVGSSARVVKYGKQYVVYARG